MTIKDCEEGRHDWCPGEPPKAPECELCGSEGELYLRARCHLTAPLQVSLDGGWLILRCYLPDCQREVARFKIAPNT